MRRLPGLPLSPLRSRLHVLAQDIAARLQTQTLTHGGPHLSAPPRPARSSVAFAESVARQRRDFLCHIAGLRRPFRSDLRGASGRKGIGWSRGCRSPSQRWHLSAGAGDPGCRDPVPSPGDPGAAARGGAEGRRELPGGSQGRCFAGWYRGSAPVRGAGTPSAKRANHRGPMTTRPNPSRLGSRDATQGEPAATLLLKLLLLQQELCLYLDTNVPRLSPASSPPGPHLTATGIGVSKRQKCVRGNRGQPGS